MSYMDTHDETLKDDTERILDRMALATFLEMVEEICHDKAEHLASNWQDDKAANRWTRAAAVIAKAHNTKAVWAI
jgi:hypothetical protein